jgi:sucrose synthase
MEEKLVNAVLRRDDKSSLEILINRLRQTGNQSFLRNEFLQEFAAICQELQKPAYYFHSSAMGELIHYTHEILLEEDFFWLILRPRVGSQDIFRVPNTMEEATQMPPHSLLELRDRFVDRVQPHILEIDFRPFYESDLTIHDPRNIGQGLKVLHHDLANKLFTQPTKWLTSLFEILLERRFRDQPLFINHTLRDAAHLSEQVKRALTYLAQCEDTAPYSTIDGQLRELGFEPGWGNTAGRVRETLELLDRLMTVPEAAILEAFIARLPGVFRIVLVSVHGWVAQDGVLGRAETAGQVAYVLDQALYLDRKLSHDIALAGLDTYGIEPQIVILTRLIPDCQGTQCNLRLEPLEGTEHAHILRVPFRTTDATGAPEVLEHWISKFEIWPYLEAFADDAAEELIRLLDGERPELIVGNYSDGNLVAYLLSQQLHATQCNIAHALEKNKYLLSDLHWQDLEPQYHFSAQFSADLISMNAADFIITSTFQEVLGTPDNTGQYEAYKCFTMPELYHVLDGIDLCSPKFNVVPPGVNEEVFFPNTQTHRRQPVHHDRVQALLYQPDASDTLGELIDRQKRPLLSFTPVYAVKNLTGLIEAYAQNTSLRDRCNLVLITGKINPDSAISEEERAVLTELHELIQTYNLQGSLRWIGQRLPSPVLGELYRAIADQQGIFLHCAHVETFGLTLLEAMISGLPVFATQFGGPSEIIEAGKSGILINPSMMPEAMVQVDEFVNACERDPNYWQHFSDHAILRVQTHYHWETHTEQLLALTNLYRFWAPHYQGQRSALMRYLNTLYHLIYKPRAEQLEPTPPQPVPL